LLVVKFGIGGNMRFLSHAETLRVFQRACVRAGIKIQYSQGFNPHPKLSLPLPRSVGVESDDDLLCLWIGRSTSAQEHKSTSELCDSIRTELSQQLPEGLELLSVTIADGKTSFQPCSATYVLEVKPESLDDKLKTRIGHLLASDNLNVQRRIIAGKLKIGNRNLSSSAAKESKIKEVDVRGFLKSIVLEDKCIVVECKISSAGSIRVEEILNLLELDVERLAAPIRRTSVQWQETDDRRRMTDEGRAMSNEKQTRG
jgi:radical SAM-linked protein